SRRLPARAASWPLENTAGIQGISVPYMRPCEHRYDSIAPHRPAESRVPRGHPFPSVFPIREFARTSRPRPFRAALADLPSDEPSAGKRNCCALSSAPLSTPEQNVCAETECPSGKAALAETSWPSKSPRVARCESPESGTRVFSPCRSPLRSVHADASETPDPPSPPFRVARDGIRIRDGISLAFHPGRKYPPWRSEER